MLGVWRWELGVSEPVCRGLARCRNIVLLTRLKTPEWRLAYAQKAVEHGWSCNAPDQFKPGHLGNLEFYREVLDRDEHGCPRLPCAILALMPS